MHRAALFGMHENREVRKAEEVYEKRDRPGIQEYVKWGKGHCPVLSKGGKWKSSTINISDNM